MQQMLHTRSNSVQNSSKKLKQYLEEETIEERNNSKLILQKNTKTSITGLTDGLVRGVGALSVSLLKDDVWCKQNAPNHRFKLWSRI